MARSGVRVDQGALAGAVVARFVVLQSEMRDVIAEREEEVVAAVVVRAEEGAGFLDQVLEVPITSGLASRARSLSAATCR